MYPLSTIPRIHSLCRWLAEAAGYEWVFLSLEPGP